VPLVAERSSEMLAHGTGCQANNSWYYAEILPKIRDHQIRDGCRETNKPVFRNPLAAMAAGLLSGKLSQPVSNLTVFDEILLGRVFSQISISCA
jgi:hypothetical protein